MRRCIDPIGSFEEVQGKGSAEGTLGDVIGKVTLE